MDQQVVTALYEGSTQIFTWGNWGKPWITTVRISWTLTNDTCTFLNASIGHKLQRGHGIKSMEASIKSYLCHDEKGQSTESNLSRNSQKKMKVFLVLFPDGVKNVKTSWGTKACQIRTSYWCTVHLMAVIHLLCSTVGHNNQWMIKWNECRTVIASNCSHWGKL